MISVLQKKKKMFVKIVAKQIYDRVVMLGVFTGDLVL